MVFAVSAFNLVYTNTILTIVTIAYLYKNTILSSSRIITIDN